MEKDIFYEDIVPMVTGLREVFFVKYDGVYW